MARGRLAFADQALPARRMLRRIVWAALVMAGVALSPASSYAQPAPLCRQALALGLDVSGSVDTQEYRLQLDGLAAALESDEVVDKFLASPQTAVEISIFEWSGPDHQRILQGWTPVTSRQVIADMADRLRRARRLPADPSTGLGRAMSFGAELLAQRPDCWSHSLDLSGDGQSNSGPRPQDVREDRALQNVVVNALVIGPTVEGRDLTSYFEAFVLHGIGSFAIRAHDFEAFEAAMIRKLLREMQGIMVSDAQAVTPGPVLVQ